MMEQDKLSLNDALALLERTPASLSALLGGLPEAWLKASEGEGSWSPRDVVEHLVHGERTNWMVRARHILAGEARPFDPFDRTVEGREDGMAQLLATFAELRRENLAALKGMNLSAADLDRTGQHPEFGEVRLGQLLATWVVHDLNHLAQIARTMAKVYAGAVGPWSAYLGILRQQGE